MLPPVCLQGSQDELALGVVDGRTDRQHQIGVGGRVIGSVTVRQRRQMLGADDVARADDHRPLDHVAQLAHVAWPPMAPEHVERALVDTPDGCGHDGLEFLDERLRRGSERSSSRSRSGGSAIAKTLSR